MLAAVAGAGMIAAPPAAAHAELDDSDPAAGSRLDQSPASVTLTFSEDPDTTLSLVRIVDSAGTAVPGASDALPVPGAPAQLRVTLGEDLPRGVYTVNWLVVSAEDGHVEDGLFTFGVRETPSPGSEVEVVLRHTSTWTSVFGALGRWLLYVGLAGLVGAASTGLFVLGGRLPQGGAKLLYAALLMAAAGVCTMVATERVLVGVPSLLPLFVTREGQFLLWLGAALVICAVAVVAFDVWPGRAALIAIGVTAAFAMLAHARAGHAAATQELPSLNVVVQWVHMMAVGVWVGGLAWLLVGLRGADPPVRARAARAFSRVATLALVVVLASGGARALVELGAPGELLSSSYGAGLLVKVGLVVVVVALGAVNHFRLVPALATGGVTYRPFRINARVELVIAAGVLAATAVLVGLSPPL